MNGFNERKFVIYILIIGVGLIYLIRLFYLQVIDDTYKLDANNNVLRYNTEYPARGLIYDRNGKHLVINEPAYDLMVIPRQVKKMDTLAFCNLIGIDIETFRTKLQEASKYSSYKPSLFEKQYSSVDYGRIQEKLYNYPGFFVQKRTLRKYPISTAAHVLGYVGEVDDKVTESDQYYKAGDYIGISGIEKSYEVALRGKKGMKVVLVDVHNRIKGSFRNGQYDTLAVAGKNLVSTLDAELQVYAEMLMQNKKGSIVAIEPATGEILTMVTSPTYDPNLLVGRDRADNYIKLVKDTMKPLFNRAAMASYPPGSTFKMAVALVGQQEGVLNKNSRLPCSFRVGSKYIHCHPHPAPANIVQSIQYSCNPFYCRTFVNTVEKYPTSEMGYNMWKGHINSFGFGLKLNTDLTNELAGNIPSADYYDRFYGKNRWKGTTIYSLGIGQGEVGVTPLQMANYCAILANKGHYYIPHLIKRIEGDTIDQRFTIPRHTTVDPHYFDLIVEAMHQVVEAGTGRAGRLKDLPYCGKTGTAQNPHGKDHSIYIAFAPKDNPQIALSVYVENAGFGSTWAVPIASLLIEKYLTGKITRPEMEKRILEANLIE